jgi:hypothetical protein
MHVTKTTLSQNLDVAAAFLNCTTFSAQYLKPMLSRLPFVFLLSFIVFQTQGHAEGLTYFGFAAIACGLDDPHDSSTLSNYSREVAGFTNINQVCVTGDAASDAKTIRNAAKYYTPLLYVEPALFEFANGKGSLHSRRALLWGKVREAISQSGVSANDIVFYLVDEPGIRGLAIADVSAAAQIIKRDFPRSRILMVEAYATGAVRKIPAEIDFWGFDAYAIRDPGAEPLYTSFLDRMSKQLRKNQRLVLIGDGNYTPAHAEAGLTEIDMAKVAANYLKLAKSRKDVAMLLFYTWAGGIDNLSEKGVRDLPPLVIKTHRRIGKYITGK